MTARPRYDQATKDSAKALAEIHGVTEAARMLGIPHPTVGRWAAKDYSSPAVEATVIATEEAVAQKVWATFSQGIEATQKATQKAMALLDDPKLTADQAARAASNLSAASERAGQMFLLLSGRATERVAVEASTAPPEEAEQGHHWMTALVNEYELRGPEALAGLLHELVRRAGEADQEVQNDG